MQASSCSRQIEKGMKPYFAKVFEYEDIKGDLIQKFKKYKISVGNHLNYLLPPLLNDPLSTKHSKQIENHQPNNNRTNKADHKHPDLIRCKTKNPG